MQRKHIAALLLLALFLCFAASGCGEAAPEDVSPAPGSVTESVVSPVSEETAEPGVPEQSEVSALPVEAPEVPAAEENTAGGRTLSSEDQKFLDENGYLTRHTEVTADALSWEFDETSGTLTIAGSGPMRDYLSDVPEWDVYRDVIRSIVLEDGITTVGDYAFYGFMQLTSVQLPDTVEYIGMGAFANAYQLADIPFPASLKEIACQAFSEVKVHKPLIIPNGVEIIASGAFHANDFWDSIAIPASVVYLEEGAFSNSLHVHDFIVDPANEFYTAIDGVLYNKTGTVLHAYPMGKETEHFAIPDTVTRIAYSAFDINFFTRTLFLPKSVREVGAEQFGLLRQLEEYIVEEGSELFRADRGALLSRDGKTLYAYPVLGEAEEYIIPDGVETLAFRAFMEAWNLKRLYVPEGIRTVGIQALQGMNGTAVYLPGSFTDTVMEIDSTALFSEASGWDLGGGFTYIPNASDCVAAKGAQEPAAMTIYYAGSQAQWDRFAAANDLWLGDTKVICG